MVEVCPFYQLDGGFVEGASLGKLFAPGLRVRRVSSIHSNKNTFHQDETVLSARGIVRPVVIGAGKAIFINKMNIKTKTTAQASGLRF